MYQFSKHFLEQIKLRDINIKEVEETLNKPDNIVMEVDLTVYQKIISSNNKTYLLRIFVNELKVPNVLITAYKTSKLNKYLQP
jgi:ribosome biogenesis protein Nip4